MILGMQSGGFLTHGIAILELAPKDPGYICTDTSVQGSESYDCSPDDFCGNNNIKYKVNYEANRENVYNWYTKADLLCKSRAATSMIAMVAFFGVFLGCLFIPRLGDL